MIDNIEVAMNNPYIFYPILIWSLFFKAIALWRAARLNQKGWYIALLVINTMSLFEIIYLIVTNPKYKESEKE